VNNFDELNLDSLQKLTKEVKRDSPSTSQDFLIDDKLKGETAATTTNSNYKPPKKGRSKTKKAVSLSVKTSLKQSHKGVKKSTKRTLKNTILSQKRTRAEENDIEDDLQKIKAIVRNVENEECGSKQQEDPEK
jgi:hypothetical protein